MITGRRIVAAATTSASGVVHRARSSCALLPAVRRKPHIATRWIATAWTAHAALVGVILFLAFVHPPVRDSIVDAAGPRQSLGRQIAGVFGGSERSDGQRALAFALDSLATCSAGSLCLLLLLAHLPVTIARAEADSARRERQAEAMRRQSPLQSAELYRSALDLTCDPARASALAASIHEIDRALAERNDDAHLIATVRGDGAATGRTTAEEPRAAGGEQLVADRYAVTTRIGRGGYGVVFRATDTVLNRDVALKQLPLSGEAEEIARFQREARVLAMLSHPNIVQVFDLVEHDGHLWMAMELVERGDLGALLKKSGPLAIADAVLLAGRIADALGYAHARGVIHRDLKPHNVLMADAHTPKVSDFGLAKIAAATVHTVEGAVMGSPHFMSPEQADGKPVDGRTDVYSLGIMLHHMIVGSVPFTGDMASVLAQHIRRPAPSLSSRVSLVQVPARLDALVARMLSKSPEDRPARMADVTAELAKLSLPQPSPSALPH